MSKENIVQVRPGWSMLTFNLLLLLGGIVLLIVCLILLASAEQQGRGPASGQSLAGGRRFWPCPVAADFVLAIILFNGHFTLQPNEACLLHAVRRLPRHRPRRAASGGPTRSTPSARFRCGRATSKAAKLKVNDKQGNPIEIAAVVVWRVEDTAQACFDVDELRGVRRRSKASRPCGTWPTPMPTTTAKSTKSRCAAAWTRCRAALTNGAARAAAQGRRRCRGGPADAPGLRSGNRPGDAAPPAGRGGDRRPAKDRPRGRQHGADGPEGSGSRRQSCNSTRNARRPWSATCWSSCAAKARCIPSSTRGRCTIESQFPKVRTTRLAVAQ